MPARSISAMRSIVKIVQLRGQFCLRGGGHQLGERFRIVLEARRHEMLFKRYLSDSVGQ